MPRKTSRKDESIRGPHPEKTLVLGTTCTSRVNVAFGSSAGAEAGFIVFQFPRDLGLFCNQYAALSAPLAISYREKRAVSTAFAVL